MTVHDNALSAIERDAIAEIANMGVSRAANSLRGMIGQEVLLSVPAVHIVTREAAARFVAGGSGTNLVAVQQSFEGPFSGRALLIFPAAQSLELVRRSSVISTPWKILSISSTRHLPRRVI